MSPSPQNRRRFLTIATEGLLGLLGACIAIPAAAYVLAPLRRRTGGKPCEQGLQDLGPVDQLPSDQWKLLTLELVQRDGWEATRARHGVWVRRRAETNEVEALSPICPHLGCPVAWHPDHAEFICPCHGGTFNSNGKLIGGPPPRSMDPLECRVRDGRVLVRWEDFQIGVAQRIPVCT